MALKLRKRELPSVKFERDNLPKFLADIPEGSDDKCFISIDARAAGSINPEYVSAIEAVDLNRRIAMAQIERADREGMAAAKTEEARAAVTEARTRSEDKAIREIMRQRLEALYSACVIDWESNIVDADTNKPIPNDAETFIGLADVDVEEIAVVISSFEVACLEAGRLIEADDEETGKN